MRTVPAPSGAAPSAGRGADAGSSSAPAPASSAAADALHARYDAIAALEPTDPGAALRAYKQLAAGDGPWAANALYAAARLALGQGDRDDARAFAAAYLKRFPRGANARDAQALLDRLARRAP
ncbi:MAG TPA: hypothetical protein VHE35_01760 [Kofleriaceae bacterium]|nr:hypothetical protein [Kofleriaceae bacterium]